MVIWRSQWNFQVETPERQLETLVCGSGERFGNLKVVDGIRSIGSGRKGQG